MKVTQMLPVHKAKPGGKQWQRSIRGRRNWDVELGPCAVIRHLRSVAFVWETKRPQADNSRSLIDRQVSCYIFVWKKNVFYNFQKLTGLWLVGVGVNHVRIYGSKVAEGLSGFQRRSCLNL